MRIVLEPTSDEFVIEVMRAGDLLTNEGKFTKLNYHDRLSRNHLDNSLVLAVEDKQENLQKHGGKLVEIQSARNDQPTYKYLNPTIGLRSLAHYAGCNEDK